MEKYGLSTPTSGYSADYSPDVDPSVANDFTAGAFRITHSSIQGYLQCVSRLSLLHFPKLRMHILRCFFFSFVKDSSPPLTRRIQTEASP